MYTITQGEFERAIYDLEQHFNVDFKGMTNRECIDELRKLCPKLHSQEELQEFAKELLKKIEETYGFLGLRVWFTLNMKSYFPNDMMAMKYDKLNEDIKQFVNNYREEKNITLKLDVYIASIELRDIYKKQYGFIREGRISDLYSILRTIHLSQYNELLIDNVQNMLFLFIRFSGDNYYQHKDLSNPEILKELYTYLAEEVGQDDVYEGHSMFQEYDGYGGVNWSV